MRNLEQASKKAFIIEVFYTLIWVFLIFLLVKFLFGYFFPFVLAFVVSYYVQKPAEKLSEKIKLSKKNIALIFAVMFYALIVAILSLLFYLIFHSVRDIFTFMPQIFEALSTFIEKFKSFLNGFFYGFSSETANYIVEFSKNALTLMAERISGYLSDFAANILKKTPSFLIASIVAFVASCYFSRDYEKFIKFFKNICGEKVSGKVIKIKDIISKNVLKIIKGYIILFAITFVELFVGFLLIGLPYPLTVAILISFVDLLPILGTGTVLIPWAILEIIFGKLGYGVSLIILYLVVTIVKNFCEPKVIGGQLGINPLFTLAAIFVGLKLFGFIGVIALPIIFIVIVKYYEQEKIS